MMPVVSPGKGGAARRGGGPRAAVDFLFAVARLLGLPLRRRVVVVFPPSSR